jgi:hypothetical protein
MGGKKVRAADVTDMSLRRSLIGEEKRKKWKNGTTIISI